MWKVCYKLYKIYFLYTFYRPNEKTASIWFFAPTTPFYIIFTDGLSIWTYQFITMYLNTIKPFYLINNKNNWKFYATTAPCFWTMHLLVLLEMSLKIFFKKNALIVPFLLHQMLSLISKINRFYTKDYYFYRCILRYETIFGNWEPFKNDEKCFLFHLKSSFGSQDKN